MAGILPVRLASHTAARTGRFWRLHAGAHPDPCDGPFPSRTCKDLDQHDLTIDGTTSRVHTIWLNDKYHDDTAASVARIKDVPGRASELATTISPVLTIDVVTIKLSP